MRQVLTSTDRMPTTVLLFHAGSAGETKEYIFTDKSITYFEYKIANSFDYVMIDNCGVGDIRISYNRPALDITNYTNGAKTLSTKEAFYVEEAIWYIKIYFITDSVVEIILKSDRNI